MQILRKEGYYLPSAFTPNGDGLNDDIRPYIIGMKQFKSFTIFNRWGSVIFRSTKYGEGWNGKHKGDVQAPSVFVWMLEYVNNENKVVRAKGAVTLLR
jgi:gliding motility-associated-like protein